MKSRQNNQWWIPHERLLRVTLGYPELSQYFAMVGSTSEEGWDLVSPYPGVMGPYAHKANQWVGFDNVDIAVEKALYVADEGLGGIMFWTIDNDDFRGTCSKTPYPIIESAKEAMYSVETSLKT